MKYKPQMTVVKSPRDQKKDEPVPTSELSLAEVLKLLSGDGHQGVLTREQAVIDNLRRKGFTK